MQRIIRFILSRRTSLLYLGLSVLCLLLTVESHSYHQSKYFNSSNWISGQLYNASSGVSNYFHLKEENRKLTEENQRLRTLIYSLEEGVPDLDSLDRAQPGGQYLFTGARVTRNSIARRRNYLTINKGSKDGVRRDMGVVSSLGVVGIVENTSSRFATVQSLLNVNTSINAKLKGTDYFGSLVWDGENFMNVQLLDIPRFAPILRGDTIVTGGMSSIFPENLPIGVITDFRIPENSSFYQIDVRLFNDMANVRSVYLIDYSHQEEIRKLENETEYAE